jgi:RNA polymerase sigma factor (sigma-70 family)
MSGSPASASQFGVEPRPPLSFEDLLRAHRRELLVHCYRMLGPWTDAEDVFQDVSLRAWRGLDRFEGRASARSWLYRIATNACLSALRGRSQRTLPDVSTAHRRAACRGPGVSALSDLRERPTGFRHLQVRRSVPSGRVTQPGVRAAFHPDGLARAAAGHAHRELLEPSTGQGVRVRAAAAPRVLEE